MCFAATKVKYIFDIKPEGTADYRKNEKLHVVKLHNMWSNFLLSML
jgi:hypothetical protein